MADVEAEMEQAGVELGTKNARAAESETRATKLQK